jgi:hypothetical protein
MARACTDANGQPTVTQAAWKWRTAFHPRIPRFSQDTFRGDRLGLTAGVQFRPTDSTEIRLDALYATYPSRNESKEARPYFRGNETTTDISNYTLSPFPDRFGIGNDSVIAGECGQYLHANGASPSRFSSPVLPNRARH